MALAAADAAMRVEDHDAALKFLEMAAGEGDARPTALRKLAAIVTSRGDVGRSRSVLLELARAASGDDRARTLAQLGRVLLASGNTEERREAVRIFEESIDAAPADGILRAQLQNELDSLKRRPSLFPAAVHDVSPEPPPAAPPVDVGALERAAVDATTPGDRVRAQIAVARAYVERGEPAIAEVALRDALREGSGEAGEMLATILERDAARLSERLSVRRKVVDLSPGHLGRLEALRAAALADRDMTYARAIEHVVRAFDPGAGPLPPPPLAGQGDHPVMLAHLVRPSADANVEPFVAAWEGGHTLFAKTPIAYAITGAERIVPGGPGPLARLFESILRVLGVPRIPLFHRKAARALEANVAITYPASALVTGEVIEETVELRWALGHALASALPQHVLLLGLPEPNARNVWGGLLAAFGPPDAARGIEKDALKLAESFWQTIPARAQRRLQELLADASLADFDLLLAGARQSARRVALFVAGDFGFAARAYLRERQIDPQIALGEGLQVLCAEHAPLADLLRVAVSPEYAHARWHPVSPASQRSPSSGRGRALL
jgi:tetratricopeptide (TPR) repeat protein